MSGSLPAFFAEKRHWRNEPKHPFPDWTSVPWIANNVASTAPGPFADLGICRYAHGGDRMGRNFDLTLATLLLALAFPLLLINAACPRGKNPVDRARQMRRSQKSSLPSKHSGKNQHFTHAIEAYEALIDATVSGKAQ